MRTIRKAKKQDAEAMILHTKKVFLENPHFYGTAEEEFTVTVEEEERWIESHRECGLLLLAEVDGQLVGMLHFKLSTKKRFAHQGMLGLSVKEAYAGRGIGSELINELLDWARANPRVKKISLEVFSNNDRGIHLYRKLGFKEEGRRVRNARLDDGTYVDDVIMAKFV